MTPIYLRRPVHACGPAVQPTRRGFLGAALGLTLLATTVSCSDPSDEVPRETPTPADSFVAKDTATIVTNGSEPKSSLLPTDSNDSGGGRVIDQLFAGLVTYGSDGVVTYDVAKSITTEDDIVFKITLNPGQKFTDGTAVTASSFVNAWNYGALKTNKQGNSSYFSMIAGYEDVSPASGNPIADTMSGLTVDDDTHFTVALSRPIPSFTEMLGFRAFYPLPLTAFKDLTAFGEAPIGNGPYMMKSLDAWQHEQQIQLVKNPTYSGPRSPQNGALTFVLYQDFDAAYADVKAGNLDVLVGTSTKAATLAEADFGSRLTSTSGVTVSELVIPTDMSGFGQDDAGRLRRQALSRALNRSAVCTQALAGSSVPATDFTSYTLSTFDPDQRGNDVLQFDLEAAKSLWRKGQAISPWTGTVKIAYNSDDPVTKIWADAVAATLTTQFAVDARSVSYTDLAQLRQNVEQRYLDSALITRWIPSYPNALAYLQPQFDSSGMDGRGPNDGDYRSVTLDAQLIGIEGVLPASEIVNPSPSVGASTGSSSSSASSSTSTDSQAPSDTNSSTTDVGGAVPGSGSSDRSAPNGVASPAPSLDLVAVQAAVAKSISDAQLTLLNDLPVIPLSVDNAFGVYSAHVLPMAFGWNGLPAYHELVKVLPVVMPKPGEDTSDVNRAVVVEPTDQ